MLYGYACFFLLILMFTAAASGQVAVGDIITFGNYEQDNDLTNGTEPIEWQVLAVENGRALVISRFALDAKPYNEEWENVTWETCTLRKWLNSDFYNSAFSPSEQDQILQVTLQNPDNPDRGTKGGNNTTDRIFLLSIDEAGTLFADNAERICKATAYAKAHDVNNWNGDDTTAWWLRSPGDWSINAADVVTDGNITSGGISVYLTLGAVRPAFWVDL